MAHAYFWGGLMLLHAVMCADVLLDLRFFIRNFGHDIAKNGGWYSQRAFILGGMIVTVGIIASVVLRKTWPRRPPPYIASTTALLCTITVTCLHVIEAISLHAVDQVMWLHVGPILLIAWLWTLGSLGTILAAIYALAYPIHKCHGMSR